jgi:hypothetical protein
MVFCYSGSILLVVIVDLLLGLIYKLNFIIGMHTRVEKTTVHTGFGTTHDFRHPLGVLEHIPHRSGRLL